MSNDAESPPLPVLDEHDAAAVIGLLIRVMRIDQANTRDREKVAELQAALATRAPQRAQFVAGIGAFGFDVKVKDVWGQVKAVIGPVKYNSAWAAAKKEQASKASDELQADNSEDDATKKQSQFATTGNDGESANKPVPKVADAILSFLRSLEASGAAVPEIKTHLFDAYGLATHEKTPGMTLYRLAKQGLVRRKGRIWFATDTGEKGGPSALDLHERDEKRATDQ